MEDITAENGWKEVVQCKDDVRDYLKVQKLDQAFTDAIFRGCQRQGQTISGFFATKTARPRRAPLRKKQGLDLLADRRWSTC